MSHSRVYSLTFAALLFGCSAREPLPPASSAAPEQPSPASGRPRSLDTVTGATPDSGVEVSDEGDPPGVSNGLDDDAPPREILYIQLMGRDLSPAFLDDMAFVKRAIEAFYRLDVRMLPPAPLPDAAWYPPRKRYRAEKLLDFLEERRPDPESRIIGITPSDISTTKGRYEDWGILGLASMDGTVCVVSTFRTWNKSVGTPEEKATLARYRFAKTVVHELGHNFGLEHCPNRGCLMEDGQGTVTTSDREYTFCDACRRALAEDYPHIPVEHPTPPWPKPDEP